MRDTLTVAPAVGDLVWVRGRVVERPGMVCEPSISGVFEWIEFELTSSGAPLTVRVPIPAKSIQPLPPPTGPPEPADPLT